MMTSDPDIKGFTLLEILVAMVIFSVTMMILFSSVKTFLHSADQVKSELSVDGRFSTGLQIMAADLEQIFILQPPRYRRPGFNDDPDLYRFTGTDELVDGTLFSRLMFASTHHLNLGQDTRRGVARITYYVHAQGDFFNLHRSDRLFPYETEINPCTDPILASHIHGFTLTFVDRQGEEYDTWDSDAESFEFTLPARVIISLQLAPEPSGRQIDTGIALPVSRRVFQ
ncbi:prepilin-type N-terminal cleavage/methylation domain-containing protein [Desulfotignum phosphitoxidans]|jgi:general secretion pathway protein J|nr:prepilin-type N-terminal cleavage/methylation domain-containing protein [Desulfotignum phosphitoxidans]MBG0778910.1 prepilin-type N-terminal cleavage/methylation domain-containing protein [Desulfotignum balticum]